MKSLDEILPQKVEFSINKLPNHYQCYVSFVDNKGEMSSFSTSLDRTEEGLESYRKLLLFAVEELDTLRSQLAESCIEARNALDGFTMAVEEDE